MKKQKRIPLKHGSARVDENCSQETIDMLNKMTELAHETEVKSHHNKGVGFDMKEVCYKCQSGCVGLCRNA